jgi:hypothetical protein
LPAGKGGSQQRAHLAELQHPVSVLLQRSTRQSGQRPGRQRRARVAAPRLEQRRQLGAAAGQAPLSINMRVRRE